MLGHTNRTGSQALKQLAASPAFQEVPDILHN
jgi:hypothetical protein